MQDSLSRWQHLKAGAIAALGYPLISVLGRTLRWRVEGLSHLEAVRAGGQHAVMAFWHGRILPATYYFRDRGIVVITSQNFDGEWIARIIERFGYGTARGSTSRGGERALIQLKRAMSEGHAAGFTVDGPRGPARRAQPGAIWLAKATGNPVLPFHLEADRYWTTRSWDRTQIPKPFSRMALAVGAPIYVQPEADEEAIDRACGELEHALAGLERRAAEMLRESAPGT